VVQQGIDTKKVEERQAPSVAVVEPTPEAIERTSEIADAALKELEKPAVGPPFTPQSPAQITKWVKGLFYGDPGVGKTFLLGTAMKFAPTRPVLLLDSEAGTMSIRDTGVDVVAVRSYEEVGQIAKWLKENNFARVGADGKIVPGQRYQTLCIDSLSELQRHVMRGILTAAVRKDPEHDPDIAEQRDWLKNAERVRKLVRGVRDLDIHVLFTCLARERQDERTGAVTIKPHLPGQLADEVSGFLDFAGYMRIGTVEDEDNDAEGKRKKVLIRRVYFQPAGHFLAKDRSGVLPVYLDNPTIEAIVGPIVNEGGNKQ